MRENQGREMEFPSSPSLQQQQPQHSQCSSSQPTCANTGYYPLSSQSSMLGAYEQPSYGAPCLLPAHGTTATSCPITLPHSASPSSSFPTPPLGANVPSTHCAAQAQRTCESGRQDDRNCSEDAALAGQGSLTAKEMLYKERVDTHLNAPTAATAAIPASEDDLFINHAANASVSPANTEQAQRLCFPPPPPSISSTVHSRPATMHRPAIQHQIHTMMHQVPQVVNATRTAALVGSGMHAAGGASSSYAFHPAAAVSAGMNRRPGGAGVGGAGANTALNTVGVTNGRYPIGQPFPAAPSMSSALPSQRTMMRMTSTGAGMDTAAQQSSPLLTHRMGHGMTGHEAADAAVEFVPHTPRHYRATTLLLAAALFGIIPLMSTLFLHIMLCSVLVLYAADFLGYRRGAVFTLLVTVVLLSITLMVSNIRFGGVVTTSQSALIVIVDAMGVFGMAATAALLHFRWLQLSFPHMMCTLERVSVALTPVFALPSLLGIATALVGARRAPLLFLLMLCVLHHVFYTPLKSSFLRVRRPRGVPSQATYLSGRSWGQEGVRHRNEEDALFRAQGRSRKGEASMENASSHSSSHAATSHVDDTEYDEEDDGNVHVVPRQLNERAEACVFSLIVMLLPAVIYNAHQGDWHAHRLSHVINTIGLLNGSLIYFCLSPSRSLWFLAPITTATAATTTGPAVSAAATEKWRRNEDSSNCANRDTELAELLLLFQRIHPWSYDAVQLQKLIDSYRTRIMFGGAVIGLHWMAYRVMHCRYSYVLDGVGHPYNIILLLIALYACLAAVYGLWQLLYIPHAQQSQHAPSQQYEEQSAEGGEDSSRLTSAQRTVLCVWINAAVVVAVICFAILGSVPLFLTLCSLNSILQLNFFLLRIGEDGANMTYFTIFSTLHLMWWIYRTFSFISESLHVFGEATEVPIGAVVLSVLICYVLACISFTYVFAAHKTSFVVCIFFHATQFTWVEHVLYSQNEPGVYPAALVVATSAIGAWMAYRLYCNEVLTLNYAAFVASCYTAKLYSFVVERVSPYYQTADPIASAVAATATTTTRVSLASNVDTLGGLADEQSPSPQQQQDTWLILEITGGWWVALVAGWVVVVFEMERRRRTEVRHAYRLFLIYILCAMALTALSVRNVQRATYEYLTHSYLTEEDAMHIAPGMYGLTYAALTLPFLSRQAPYYLFLRYASTMSQVVGVLGALLLLVQPTRIVPSDRMESEAWVAWHQYYHAAPTDMGKRTGNFIGTDTNTAAIVNAGDEGASLLSSETIALWYATKGRLVAFVGLCLLVLSRVLLSQPRQLPSWRVRVMLWTATALALGVGAVPILFPIPTHTLAAAVSLVILAALLLLDVLHYRTWRMNSSNSGHDHNEKMDRSGLVIVCVCMAAISIMTFVSAVMVQRVLNVRHVPIKHRWDDMHALDQARRNETLHEPHDTPHRESAGHRMRYGTDASYDATEMANTVASLYITPLQRQTRLRMLSLLSMISLFVAVLLRCRAEARSLLPRVAAASMAVRRRIALIANYMTMLAMMTLCFLNYWDNDSDPVLYILYASLLLLLSDDGVFFVHLHQDSFRYFPPALAAMSLLWFCVAQSIWAPRLSWSQRVWDGCRAMAMGALILPAQISFLHFCRRRHSVSSSAASSHRHHHPQQQQHQHHDAAEATARSLASHGHRARDAASAPFLLFTMAPCALVLFLSPLTAVKWQAVVTVCAQCVRLFDRQMQYIKHGVETA